MAVGQVFNMARQDDIYIELVLLNHGAFSATVDPEWDANPYNSANGGPCDTPQCFATDPQAKQYFQRRLRYIAARWDIQPIYWIGNGGMKKTGRRSNLRNWRPGSRT